jgi:MFS family permease
MNPVIAVGAIINGVVLLQAGTGLLNTLLPIRMQDGGFTATEIGLVAAGFSAGFLAGCIYAPYLILRIGHIRAFSAFATMLSALTLGLAIETEVILWTVVRVLSGFCFAGLLTVSDSWISGETERSVRGRVLSVYMILYKLAQAAGPLILTIAVIDGNWHFMLVSALFSLSLLPVALRHGDNPTPPSPERMGLLTVYRLTPLTVVGCVCVGTANSAMMNLIPLYGVEVGLGVGGAVILASVLQFGALGLQWPMGWASDRRDRRVVMIAGMIGMAAVSAVIVLLPSPPLWVYAILIAVTGGFGFSIYPIMVAHAGDFVEPNRMVPLCATLMLAFAFGMVLGPITGSAAMQLLGPSGLFVHTILFAGLFVAFALYRMNRRAAPATPDRPAYVNVPLSSTAIGSLDPRTPQQEVEESVTEALGADEDRHSGPEDPRYSPSGR